jgi:signal transduction histidine kinase
LYTPYRILLALLLLSLFGCKKDLSRNDISKDRITMLLDSASGDVVSDFRREKYLDTAYNELRDKKNDTLTRYFYRKTASTYYNLGKYDKSLIVGKKILNLAKEAKDTATMARAYYYTADSFYEKADNDSAFFYYTQAEKLYDKMEDLGTMGEVLLYKAYIYYNIGLYNLCESEAFKALRMLQARDKTTHLYNCYNLIATALDGQDQNDDAIDYFRQALNILKDFKKEGYTDEDIALYRASCYNNMGLVYVKMKNFDEAVRLYKDALAIPGVREEQSLYAKLINNLAYAEFQAGNRSRLPELFYESLKIRQKLNNKSGIVTSKTHLAEYFASVKDTAKAIRYLKEAYSMSREINSHSDLRQTLRMLSVIDEKNSNFYNKKYFVTDDSLNRISKANKDYFARVEYETDKLQTEKEALVRKNSFIIGVSAVILLFIAAIFIIYYLNTKNKELLLLQDQQKANEELYQLMFEQQTKVDRARNEEKNRIAMELHDGILNNIYAVRLNLEFINKKADEDSILKRREYIKELQNVESEIRGVSHDLSRSAIFREEKSFANLLEFLVDSQKNNFNTLFEIYADPNINWEDMSNIVKINLYRMIQEGLQNINKYSEATEASIEITRKENIIQLIIKDNGKGFDTEAARGGIGLKNLSERAASLNGTISIKSTPGSGTVLEIDFPIAQ